MNEYIRSRTGSDKYPIGEEIKHLTKVFHPASVTLRSSGKLLARSYRADTNLCRSVLAAALDAMRSRNLPNRVTPKYLASLTVEVEVHGRPRAVSPGELSSSMVMGLTGLKVSRDQAKGCILPSTACSLGLSPAQVYSSCLAQLPGSSKATSQTDAWSIFTSKHYVGYSDSAVIRLFRGKMLVPPQDIAADTFSTAASTVGLFLANSQDADGRYRTSGPKAPIHDHLYATYAMAKLARHDKRKLFSQSVDMALRYAAGFVLSDDKQARILVRPVGDRTKESPTQATAWMLLAITELPPDKGGRTLAAKLAAALQQDVVSIVGPEHGMATPDQLLDWSIALTALRKFLPNTAKSAKLIEPLQRTMAAWSLSGQKLSPMVLRGTGGLTKLPQWRQIDDSDLPDRRGGFVSSGSEPTTLDTAAAAVCLSAAMRSPSITAERKAEIGKQILRARQFCRQMLYRSKEAYWTDKPAKMIGGMRISPGSAAVSIGACAAAIEAFLLN